MMRPLFVTAAAALLGVGLPAAQAQCGCARPAASVSVRTTAPGVKSAVPTPSVISTASVHHTSVVTPAAGCAACAAASGAATVVSVPAAPVVSVVTATTAASCPHCAANAAQPSLLAPDDKPKGEEKPGVKAEKEVTLTGTMVCAKCGLKEPGVKKCTNAIQVKDGEMTVTYFLDDKGNGETYHEGLCGGGTKAGAKVTGTTSEKDGKRWVKATKVEEKK